MNGEISDKNYVVNTRNTGKFYVTKSQADFLFKALNAPTPPRVIKISDDIQFSANDYVNTMPAWKDDEVRREKNGEWKCGQGNWHDKYQKCSCNWGMDTSLKKTEERELSDQEKARGKLMFELMKLRYPLKLLKDLKGKSNEEIETIIKQYSK
jgi:hypothetical protein